MHEIPNPKETKIIAQRYYCREKKAPFFAPTTVCFSCQQDIWEKITLERAATSLITGCPVCNRSYCD